VETVWNWPIKIVTRTAECSGSENEGGDGLWQSGY